MSDDPRARARAALSRSCSCSCGLDLCDGDPCTCIDEVEAEIRAAVAQERADIKRRLSDRLNNYLCEMREGYDDSMVGFNEAWDVMRKLFDDMEAAAIRARETK